jgi:hypothetical protein
MALKMMRVMEKMAQIQKGEVRSFSVTAWGVQLRNQEAML